MYNYAIALSESYDSESGQCISDVFRDTYFRGFDGNKVVVMTLDSRFIQFI
jgi:hypothetical protein